jgi:hypothetical protein
MKLCLLFALVVVGTLGSQEVKHAPTVEQCSADQKLWLSKLESSDDVVPASFKELAGWQHEMFECMSVDPQMRKQYFNVYAEINSEKVIRLERFLDRHKLYDQFIAEDTEGKRR